MHSSFPFDAVLFDLDGTLVATDRFWIQAARTGARRAFSELGIARSIPSHADWMGLVGQPLDEGFDALLGDLDPASRRRVQAACVEEEHRLLDAGGAAWMPGGEAALATLAEQGVRIGIASNCSQSYLDHMLDVLGVGRFAQEARCLDSPGVRNKADMIASLLESFDTRSAVFVGDRIGDRDSAWANAIPHVHCAFGFAGKGEGIEAQAVIEDLGELLPRLERRDRWIEECLEAAGLFRNSTKPPFAVAITGLPLSGKSLFARGAVRILQQRGIPAAAAELSTWSRGDFEPNRTPSAANLLAKIDLKRLGEDIFAPLGRGEALALDLVERDFLGLERSKRLELDAGGVLFLTGEGLLDPSVAGRFERSLWLDISADEVLRRAAGREGRALGPAPLEALRSGRLATARLHRERYDPSRLADLVVPAENPLGPR